MQAYLQHSPTTPSNSALFRIPMIGKEKLGFAWHCLAFGPTRLMQSKVMKVITLSLDTRISRDTYKVHILLCRVAIVFVATELFVLGKT